MMVNTLSLIKMIVWKLVLRILLFLSEEHQPRDSQIDLISELERIGVTCINSRTTIQICADHIVVTLD